MTERAGTVTQVSAPTLEPVAEPVARGSRPRTRRPLLGRSPALDGLRGFALIWVVKGALGLGSRGRIALSDEERSPLVG